MKDKCGFKTEFEDRDDLSKSSTKNLEDGVALWASFYRENSSRFIMDYLGFNLHIFQQILIYAMDKCNLMVFIASRGLGRNIFTNYLFCTIL